MIYAKYCPRCHGDCFIELDLDVPALADLCCLQCGWRASITRAVPHPPATPDERRQSVFAEARANSIAHLHLVQSASRAEVIETLGVSPRTIDRAIHRAGGRLG